jgi:hypothetical protein
METGRSALFFCSYSRDDSTFALKLASELRNAGVSMWIDQLDIPGGRRWDDAIQTALASCNGVIAVISPKAVNSQNFMDEVSYALDEGKRLIPVLHRECVVPFRLRRMQRVDFTGDFEKGFTELLRAVRSELTPATALFRESTAESDSEEATRDGERGFVATVVPVVTDAPPGPTLPLAYRVYGGHC